VEWKLARGTWRPKLLDYAKALAEQDVETKSTAAFKRAGAALMPLICGCAEPIDQDRQSLRLVRTLSCLLQMFLPSGCASRS
jgi:hypothetical protein